MARLQIGKASCQISGKYVPVADFKLTPEDGLYFPHHALLYRDNDVVMGALPLRGGFRRLLAGMPVIMSTAQGPGHIAFSRDAPGELIAVPVHPGQAIHAPEHAMLVATSNVAYDFAQTNIWFATGGYEDPEYSYPLGMYMDVLSVPGQTPGLVLVHASGNAFIRNLAAGETMLIQPTSLLYKDASVMMYLHMESPAGMQFSLFSNWYHRYSWIKLTGPGRVAIQSAFGLAEDNGKQLVDQSPGSSWDWSYGYPPAAPVTAPAPAPVAVPATNGGGEATDLNVTVTPQGNGQEFKVMQTLEAEGSAALPKVGVAVQLAAAVDPRSAARAIERVIRADGGIEMMVKNSQVDKASARAQKVADQFLMGHPDLTQPPGGPPVNAGYNVNVVLRVPS
jgi:uncharacterized protein (AIM24 family)